MGSERPGQFPNVFDLGEFQIDPQRRTISGPSGEITVEPKVMAVLLMFANRPGEVIRRDEFIEAIWAREFGGDESLTRAVSHLRKVFRDARGAQTQIETVPKTGYRLLTPDTLADEGSNSTRSRRVVAFGLLLLLVTAIAIVFVLQKEAEVSVEPSAGDSIVLAVLAFDIQSELPEDASIAIGLADEILSALSRNPSLAVIAGNSSFKLTGEQKGDLEGIANLFNASHVVDGSVRRSDEDLRISVHLVELSSGLVTWSKVAVRPESEIFAIRDSIAGELQQALGFDAIVSDRSAVVPDPEVYEAFLSAKALLRAPWGPNIEKALTELEAVVKAEPGIGEAWTTLALFRLDLMIWQEFAGNPANADPPELLRQVRKEANAALAVNPDSIDAKLALAIADDRDGIVPLATTVNRVETLLGRAPNHPRVNLRMGRLMNEVGRFEEAVKFMYRSMELDPLAILPQLLYADALISSGRADLAHDLMKKANGYQNYLRSYSGLAMQLLTHDFDEARRQFVGLEGSMYFGRHGLIPLGPYQIVAQNTPRLSGLMSRLIAVAEQESDSLDPSIATDLVQAANEGLIPHVYICQLLAAAGLNEAAMDLAMKRIMLRDVFFGDIGILLRPAFREARTDLGIMALFDASGLLDYWMESGNWPDFCLDAELPYDCEEVAILHLAQKPDD